MVIDLPVQLSSCSGWKVDVKLCVLVVHFFVTF